MVEMSLEKSTSRVAGAGSLEKSTAAMAADAGHESRRSRTLLKTQFIQRSEFVGHAASRDDPKNNIRRDAQSNGLRNRSGHKN